MTLKQHEERFSVFAGFRKMSIEDTIFWYSIAILSGMTVGAILTKLF